MTLLLKNPPFFGLSWMLLALAGCAPIRISTPEPIKVDISARVDVVSKESADKEKETPISEIDVAKQRRERMGEVQQLKNDRIIGENREGYLSIRKLPADPGYAEYAKKVVDAENKDRQLLYSINAESKGQPLAIIEREYANQWRSIAYPGEWIQQPDGQWIAK